MTHPNKSNAVFHPKLASKSLSLELWELTGWDDVSHFCIRNGGTVNLDTVQRKYISKDRIHPQYDLSFLLDKINSVLAPLDAYKQWYQQLFEGSNLEDAACMLVIRLVNKSEISV